jgi:hypothetical protein
MRFKYGDLLEYFYDERRDTQICWEKSMKQPRRYYSYLLRLWQESSSSSKGAPLRDPPQWRASLERPQSGERLGFASLKELITFLETETGVGPVDQQSQEEEGQ